MTPQPSSNSHRKNPLAIAGGAFLLRLIVLMVGKTYWYKEIGPAWDGKWGGSAARWLRAALRISLRRRDRTHRLDRAPLSLAASGGLQSLRHPEPRFGFRHPLDQLRGTAPAMCVLLYRISSRVWNQRMGLAAAFAWAVFPNSVWYDTCLLWDTILTTCVFFTAR